MNCNSVTLKAPFPYFGGKSAVADLVWERFGDVDNYIEPFAGSIAVLLRRPTSHIRDGRILKEKLNDANHYIVNFWRAVQADPERVAYYADWPIAEADLHARHRWLRLSQESHDFREKMRVEPDAYDPKIAGWWVWGQSCWIAGGWCDNMTTAGKRQRPNLACRQGVHTATTAGSLLAWMQQLSDRLRHVRTCYGHWSRVCDSNATLTNGARTTGVFLDPPYPTERADNGERSRDGSIYATDNGADLNALRDEIIDWCRRWAPQDIKIAVCGYEGDGYETLGWESVDWKSQGGYANLGSGQRKANAHRERIWFSPACQQTKKQTIDSLFHDEETTV
jgi:hypothetical protein